MASAPPMRATSGHRIRGSVSAEEQAQWLARFESSGQSVRAFCAEHGLRPTMLTWWRRRRRERARQTGADGALMEVTRLTQPVPTSVFVEVVGDDCGGDRVAGGTASGDCGGQ